MWVSHPEDFKIDSEAEDLILHGAVAVQTLHSIEHPIDSPAFSVLDVWGAKSESDGTDISYDKRLDLDFSQSLLPWKVVLEYEGLKCHHCSVDEFDIEGYLYFEMPIDAFRERRVAIIFDTPSETYENSIVSFIRCRTCLAYIHQSMGLFDWKRHWDEWNLPKSPSGRDTAFEVSDEWLADFLMEGGPSDAADHK